MDSLRALFLLCHVWKVDTFLVAHAPNVQGELLLSPRPFCYRLHLQFLFTSIILVCVSVCVCTRAQSLIHVQLCVTPWTIACQAPLFMELSRQEYWSGLPFPTPGDLPNPGIESMSLASSALTGRFLTTALPRKHQTYNTLVQTDWEFAPWITIYFPSIILDGFYIYISKQENTYVL